MIDYAVTLEFDTETENKIVLAKAEPYEELRAWELK